MPPADDPLARLHGRASFFDTLQSFWQTQFPPRDISSSPRIGGRELDLYIFFEAIRGLGGIEHVAQNGQFSILRDFFQLPSVATQYATQMRNSYDRLCAPCETYLISALERTYKGTNLHSETHDWLRARVDFSDLNSSISASRQSPRTSNANDVTEEMKDQQDFLTHSEAAQAAIRGRMRVDTLEPAETAHWLFNGNECELAHVDIRNHILRMWYRHSQRRLDVYTALVDLPLRFHELGCRVFSYLECTGAINFGAVSLMTPVALRRAQAQAKQGAKRDKVAIVGAGISGLIAARQLRSFGISVTVFEARNRPGGRIRTERGKFSTGVDMGAMLITGVIQNPVAVLASQTNASLHFLDTECPLFDIDGTWVSKETDTWAEKEYNAILDATARYRRRGNTTQKAKMMSLGEAFQKALRKRVARRKERIQAYKNSTLNANLKQQTEERDPFLDSIDEDDIVEVYPVAKRRDAFSPASGDTGQSKWNHSTIYSSTQALSRSPAHNRKRIRHDYRSEATSTGRNNGNMGSTRNNTHHGQKLSKKPRTEQVSRSNTEDSSPGTGSPMDDKLISRLLRWHIANLEYACAADINKVSLMHWDQDDPYGFQGEHVLLKSGYEPVLNGLVKGLERNMCYSTEVIAVTYSRDWDYVEITTKSKDGEYSKHTYDAVLITVPLGVLKKGTIVFRPPLPAPKLGAISRLGTGGLMKVAMEFTHQFWIETDMFGALRESPEKRGEFYFFWNLVPCTGKLILVAVVAEPSASEKEKYPDEEVVDQAMMVLRRCYPDAPDPIAFAVTRWSTDRFSKGAYTNIPVGSCGEDYDLLAAPVDRIFFAGEHTCRTNPTTCASGLISGLREAYRIIDSLDMIPAITKTHSDTLKDILNSRKERHAVDGNRDTSPDSSGKRAKLSVEPMTPQTPPEEVS